MRSDTQCAYNLLKLKTSINKLLALSNDIPRAFTESSSVNLQKMSFLDVLDDHPMQDLNDHVTIQQPTFYCSIEFLFVTTQRYLQLIYLSN